MIHISDKPQHIVDTIVMPVGAIVAGHEILEYTGHLVEGIINPILTSVSIFVAIIWGVYRILEIRDNRKKNKTDSEE